MRNIRQLLVALMITSLAACGGGGTLDSGGDGGTGGGGSGGNTPVFSLNVALTNQAGAQSNNLSQDTPLTVTATLTATNNGNVANRLITFAVSGEGLATLGNDAGSASTNADGVATIALNVGNRSGSGEVTANFGETSASAVFNSAGDGGDEVDVTVGSVSLIADTLQLGTGASSKVELSALVRDANNVVLADIPVTFSSDSGELVQIDSVTGANGVAKATLTSQTNKTNRDVLVTARVQQQTTQLTVAVVGTTINIAGPKSVVLGDTSTIDFFVTDSNGIGIQGTVLEVVSSLGNTLSDTSPVTSGTAGKASISYTATTSGTDTLTVTALGVTNSDTINISADQFTFLAMVDGSGDPLSGDPVQEVPLNSAQEVVVEWQVNNAPPAPSNVTFNTTRGNIANTAANLANSVTSADLTDAEGKASAFIRSPFAGLATISARGGDGDTAVSAQKVIEFVAVNPTQVEAQAFPAQIGVGESSAVRAILRDSNNNPVKNQTIVFSLNSSAGGTISTGTAVTNSQGVASTVFTADTTTGGGVNGQNLVIKASLQSDDTIFDETDIAVGQRTLFFRFGTGNVITKPSASTYAKEFSVIVTDSSGNAVAGQQLNLAVLSVNYRKGYWVKSPEAPAAFKNWTTSGSTPGISTPISCVSEDANFNGILDGGEDINGDGLLTPGNFVVAPGSVTSDASGIATFNITYPQDVGSWLDVRLQVSGFASGTENVSYRHYSLPTAAEDLTTETSQPASNPFGVIQSCAVAG
ncbi:beta strand repeat-containing protein [Arsukibacterium sp.]|uniref:beta strand repeat-containing protein n=1 Tax=Arsukibacterium sp. TaxID=1977258 RepID=UPI00299DA713|nr:Ig-like domain-containing protein [Arsukibacterium sp.]MDX1678036.1 Ig-like domain-containing protein [Arsukibacterium sp.]